MQGCATRSPYEEASDPLEPVNRAIYRFNDTFDRYLLKPVAERYQEYVPAPARTGVRNFYNNLQEPVTIVNQVLQGKPALALSDTMRFGFNTVFGVFGLVDVSTGWGLEHHTEDFGQTFGVWGFGEGWYLMLPFLGPSTVRDAAGLPLEFRMGLWQFASEYTNAWGTVGYYSLLLVSRRADLLSASQVLDTAALDAYLQVRAAYRQRRWYDIYDGEPPEPDFFDDELFTD
ncbi:MAG: VacJ family lipoprotein [Gammaproteobacteria bacterium]|jgi:phospholipid-binding lipoprotein MlaA